MINIGCPSCGNTNIYGLMDARENTLHYGTGSHILQCGDCQEKIKITLIRIVVCDRITKADDDAEFDYY